MILALLTVPTGMWAEEYDLWVAGTQVSSDNASDVLGDGKVSWNNSSNTLTLNGATINGTIVSNVNSAITIHLIGTSTITTTQNQMPIQSSLSTEPGLTFTAAEGAMLLTNKSRTNGDAVICSGFSFSSEQDIPEGYRLSWDADEICSLAEYYDIYFYTFVNNSQYFQPYYVTAANCDRLMGTYNETSNQWDNNTIAVSYNYSQKTLTLNNAIFESAEPYNTTYFLNCDGYKAKTLTINLLGENKFIQNSNEPGAKFATMNVYEGNFIITTDANNPGSLTSVDLYSEDSEYFNFINGDVEYQNGLQYSYAGDGIRYIRTAPESYDLWIDGEQVTSANKNAICLGQVSAGVITFDGDHTLTLNDVPWISFISSYPFIKTSMDLTVHLVGTSQPDMGNVFIQRVDGDNETHTLTFTTDPANPGMFLVRGGSWSHEGFTVVYENGLAENPDGYYDAEDNDKPYAWIAPQLLGLKVAGTAVTAGNAANVLGEETPTVTFDASTNTLTLNNATLSGSIEKTASETGEQLIINLVGTNTVNGQILFQSPDRMYPGDLTFTGSGSLNIASNDENGVIDGVSSVNTAEGLYIATDTPDPICYNGYYIAGNSGSVMSLTVSTNVTYPVWVYNTSTTHYTQLTAATSTFTTPEQNADENHSGSVSFSNNTLTLTNFLCKTTENNDFVFYIGKSLKNLAVNLVGESYIHQNGFHYAEVAEGDESTLTYTTLSNGSLTFIGEPSYWTNNIIVNYENGLGYYSNVISTDWPRLLIGGTYVRGTANTIEGYDNVSYDDDTNTLSLGGVTIGSQNSTVTDITVYIKDLNVEISGTNTVYGRFYGFYEENGSRAGTITFKKKSDAETANLTVSGYGEGGPVTNFVSSTLEEGLFISGINTENEQATYVRFDGGDYYDENGNSLKEVSITLNEPNTKLWIGGTAVTSDNAEDVFDGDENLDGKVSYNMTTQTLSLNGVTIEGDIVSNVGTLTIDLTGTNTLISISASGNATALAFTGEGTLSLENSDGVISGFSSVDFGSFNLLSSTSGIHWSETRHALCDYNDDMAGEVTLTNEVVYPLWINGVQVTGGNAANVLADEIKSVSYDSTNQILTLRGANFGRYDAAPIMVGEEISALTLHLIGNSCIYADGAPIIVFANANSSLTVTTSNKLPGSLSTTNLSTVEPTFQNGLTYKDGTISASLANTEVAQFTGKSIYVNTENGDNSFIYSAPDFYASYATGEDGGAFVKVSTIEGATTATMWPSSLMDAELQYKVTLQLGALTASDATVQVIGWGQEYDNDGYPTGIFVADGKTYSNAIALSTADADGIIEIPLTSAVTSENLQLVFSSSSSFSFMPISIAFTAYSVYDIRIGNIAITDNNASNITGEGITGTISYDDETHTLTLNNATIEPEMEAAGIDYTGTADLTICLIGSSTVYGAENCEAIRYNGDGETTPNLIFAKGDGQTCSLHLSAYDNVISGFDNVDYGGMFTLNDEDDGIYTTIITSTLLGGGTGTADDPFLIKTPEDLKMFAQYNNSGVISRQASVKLNNSINCEELEDFEPIGDNTFAFAGTFNGNNCTISNLEFVSEEDGTWYAGLFGRVEGSAVIEKLTLSNCTFKGGSNVGTIAAYLASGTIQDCNVNACEVETRSSQNPYAGGVTGEIENGTVQRCKVVGSTVKCVTSYDEEGGETTSGGIAGYINQGTISACEVENTTIRSSHVAADGYQTAAGIVGTCNMWSEGSITISNNMVKGTTTVSAEDNTPEGESGTPLAGAVVGLVSPSSTLSNNTYEYSVTISTKAADAAASTVSGYTQRGSGSKIEFEGSDGYPELYAELTDDFENNGAVMYTKKVTLPEETDAASVMGEEGTYYSTVVESDVLSILVAPGQTVTLNATPGEGYAITSLTATNTTTEAAISTNSEELGDNITQYTFTMPDAPVTVALLTAQTIANVFVAGLENAVYSGEAIVPEFTVKASANAEANLVEGTDYEVSYKQGETTVESMINAGTYTIVISGIGAYYGTKDVSFEITQTSTTITFAQESYSAILGESFTSPETVDNWDVTPWASENESVATVSEGVITINGVGTTTITVFYAGDENHLSTTASYQLVVSRNLEVAFVGSNSWASYYATENLALPEGLTAYVVSDVNETSGVVTVESIGYIPANNGVLLKRAEGADADGYVAGAYTGSTSTFTNMLSGSANSKAISSFGSDPVYVLFNDKFKRATSGTIPARRAYLFLPTTNAGGAPQLLTLNVVDGISTAISTLAADDNDGSWYTLDGFKLSGKPQQKGVYIKNGKKVYFNNHK